MAETRPSRHIDAALDAIDRLMGEGNERGKTCQLCGGIPKNDRIGLCSKCIRSLKEEPASAPADGGGAKRQGRSG